MTDSRGGHARASAVIAAGTLASRLSGLLRSVVLVMVVGSFGPVANAFYLSNSLPTNIYELVAAGVLTGILVPQIVRAASHSDGGARFVSKLLTLGIIVMLVVTGIVIALAPALITLYAPESSGETRALTIAFAYWCLPQLFFYGLYALLGEILNARRAFGPYTWAPVVNNVVSIVGFVVFLTLFGGSQTTVSTWTPAMITLLGATATSGIALQALVLLLFWRRTGLAFRPDFRWRGMGLRHMSRLAGWTFLTVLIGQVAALVQLRVMSAASGGDSASVAALTNAWLIFMLPHSIVAMSISTAFFTSLAEDVAGGRRERIRENIDESVRGLSVFAFGFAAAIAAASVPLSRVFSGEADKAVPLAVVLCCYIVALVPFGILVVVRRAFFAFHDTRTPLWFTLVQCTLAAGGALLTGFFVSRGMLPLALLGAGIALTQSLSTYVQLPVALRLLRRHTGRLDLRPTWLALGRFLVAAAPALAAGWGVFLLLGGPAGWTVATQVTGVLGAAIVGGATLVVYVVVLAALRAPELTAAWRTVRRRIRR